MPQCYGLLLSLHSSIHATTNMWDIHGLIESIQTRHLPITIPLEIHVFWYFASEEVGADFEARLVMSIDDDEIEPSEPMGFTSSTPYSHLRLRQVVLKHVGAYRAYIEWRRRGANSWRREEVFWPFTVSLAG